MAFSHIIHFFLLKKIIIFAKLQNSCMHQTLMKQENITLNCSRQTKYNKLFVILFQKKNAKIPHNLLIRFSLSGKVAVAVIFLQDLSLYSGYLFWTSH